MLFSDDSIFRIQDWFISHSHILLRSAMSENNPDSENIDLIFVGVSYLEISDIFRGIKISHANEKDEKRLKQRIDKKTGVNFFEIISCGYTYYIGAVSFRVERNKLDMLESSLGYWPLTRLNVPQKNIFDDN